MSDVIPEPPATALAVIGLSGCFPGAPDAETFWENLTAGRETTRPSLEESALFDAAFFGIERLDAELTDPQHRHFYEQAWRALEDAGYVPSAFEGTVGVFSSTQVSSYLFHNLLPNRRLAAELGEMQLRMRNDKDFLASMTAYRLGLTGPTIGVQTGCSGSLVAVCVAGQSLLTHQCDMALVGGASIYTGPRGSETLAPQDGIFSRDGRCRTFDASATGTVNGSGVGVVALRRYADAVADGDTIRAVIRGFATNNDGAMKVGLSAPGMDGQAEVIAMAQAMAQTHPDTISYIEAHGTGTPLGDSIEVAALNRVFRAATERRGYCAIGSVKTNIGHLDAAAGIAGLIKTVLALEHGQLPPSLHFERPNPEIDFDASPFFVQTRCAAWPADNGPRRAGVSAFAIGGANAHVVLEEAPRQHGDSDNRGEQLLVLSAASPEALDKATTRLATHLEAHAGQALADIAYTLQCGRRAFAHRRAAVVRNHDVTDHEDAVTALQGGDPQRLITARAAARPRPVAFLLPGLGDHQPGMTRQLYDDEPAFRHAVDCCAEQLRSALDCDLRTVLYPRRVENADDAFRRMVRGSHDALPTELAHPALFTLEYALAQLWISWGVKPQALAGYSLGEYTAACLAGVLTLEDALHLVAGRARLIADLPAGAMLVAALAPANLADLLSPELVLAAVGGPELSILAGPTAAIDHAAETLQARDVVCRRLATRHAFHSPMMEPAVEGFAALVADLTLAPPQLPLLSNVSGTWMTTEQATDPAYWVEHLLSPVRFGDQLAALWRNPGQVLLEVGPGQTLSAWALQHPDADDGIALASAPHALDPRGERAVLLHALGTLWAAGVDVDWGGLHTRSGRRRVPLPTYPFERQHYWIKAPENGTGSLDNPTSLEIGWLAPTTSSADATAPFDLERWLAERPDPWLVFTDGSPLMARATAIVAALERPIIVVDPGEDFTTPTEMRFTLAADSLAHHERLLTALRDQGMGPATVLHLWSAPSAGQHHSGALPANGQRSLLLLAQAAGRVFDPPLDLAAALVDGAELRTLRAALAQADAAARAAHEDGDDGRDGRPARPPYAAPRNTIEENLCRSFATLLGVEQVGIHESFFDLGGDSLKATRLLALIERELGVAPRLKDLFAAPSVAQLAVAVVQEQAAQTDEEALLQALAESKNLSRDELAALLADKPA